MLEPARYLGIFVVVLSILAALVVEDLLLVAIVGHWPPWLLPHESPIGWEGTPIAAGKVAGVAVESRNPQSNGRRRLAVILGQSTAREGLDPTVLEAQGPPTLRWLSLCGSGGSISFLTDPADVLFFSKLNPELVVLAINPYMLAGHPYQPPTSYVEASGVLHHLGAGEFYQARTELASLFESQSWIFEHRRIINHQMRVATFRSRLKLFQLCGLQADALYAPLKDPWIVQRSGYPPHQSEQRLQRVWAASERLGRFSPASYSVEDAPARSLVDIIAHSRLVGAKVYVVLMPEKSVWRNIVPPEAEKCLQAALANHFGETRPPVIDLRATLADDLFSDYYHLNTSGRDAASQLLAGIITVKVHQD
jgi:hypothetical protein